MKTLLKEANGNISSMRVALFIVLVCIMAPSVYYAMMNNQPSLDLSWEQVSMLLGMFGAKAVQRKNESVSV